MPYIKQAFDVTSFNQAKHVVLSNDPNDPDKFQKETQFLVQTIQAQVELNENTTVLDFGCGMGRVAKEIVRKYNSRVIGLDISPSMLMFAKLYTANSDKFLGTHSYDEPESIDVALSIFALQHSEDPKKELDNIISNLKINGIFVLLNENKRLIPNGVDNSGFIIWGDDEFDIVKYTSEKLKKINSTPYFNTGKDIIFYRKEL